MNIDKDFERMIVMEKILIDGKEYAFIKDYKSNDLYRKSYNSLTKKIYGFDFEQWFQTGYWGNGYIPYLS